MWQLHSKKLKHRGWPPPPILPELTFMHPSRASSRPRGTATVNMWLQSRKSPDLGTEWQSYTLAGPSDRGREASEAWQSPLLGGEQNQRHTGASPNLPYPHLSRLILVEARGAPHKAQQCIWLLEQHKIFRGSSGAQNSITHYTLPRR